MLFVDTSLWIELFRKPSRLRWEEIGDLGARGAAALGRGDEMIAVDDGGRARMPDEKDDLLERQGRHEWNEHDERAGRDDRDGAVELPITDVLDLHSFAPREMPEVVREYVEAAYAKGLRALRIIHGRGAGVQRQTVRTLLARDPRVEAFGDAPLEAGGWGATWVRLR
ncbi:MAG TPA: Smr/MutS family protein [Thermoanaerobaculia bacterium]|nr:Smr/MutS family protein [Thermoanaerobaculia bacterium]